MSLTITSALYTLESLVYTISYDIFQAAPIKGRLKGFKILEAGGYYSLSGTLGCINVMEVSSSPSMWISSSVSKVSVGN